MNLEKYEEGFLQHLKEHDLYLNDYSWENGTFTDPHTRFLFSLYLLTVSQLESVKLVSDLPFATGEQLDRIADKYDIVRNFESDASLRNRILSKQQEMLK